MRKFLLAAALACSAITGGCSKTETSEASPKEEKIAELTVDQVEKGLADKSLTAADCNHEELRKKLGVVPGAILIQGADEYPASQLPADKTAKLVFYCADPG
jgi:hypothetical protein